MGVIQCGRGECENILCSRLILNDGYYICDDCWEELLGYKSTWPPTLSVKDAKAKIEHFMHTPVGTMSVTQVDRDKAFELAVK